MVQFTRYVRAIYFQPTLIQHVNFCRSLSRKVKGKGRLLCQCKSIRQDTKDCVGGRRENPARFLSATGYWNRELGKTVAFRGRITKKQALTWRRVPPKLQLEP